MTNVPMLPDLEPDYERSIDELIRAIEKPGLEYQAWKRMERRLIKRKAVRDALLDLNDQLNDAGLVIVPAADWEAGQALLQAKVFQEACLEIAEKMMPPVRHWSSDAGRT